MRLVREATTLDLFQCMYLGQQFFEQSQFKNLGFDASGLATAAAMAINDHRQLVLVAVKDNRVVGFLWGFLCKEPWAIKHYAYIKFLFVDKDNRDFFCASNLVKGFKKWAEEVPVEVGAILTGTDSGIDGNRPAEVLYRRYKFKPMGRGYILKLGEV